jgi:hypothetical protein
MSVDVSAFMSSLGYWEKFEYFACGVVFLGVAGEIVADFTKIIKDEHFKKRFAKASAIALLLGLGGELVSLIKVSIVTGQIITGLNEETKSTSRAASTAQGQLLALKERLLLQDKTPNKPKWTRRKRERMPIMSALQECGFNFKRID